MLRLEHVVAFESCNFVGVEQEIAVRKEEVQSEFQVV